jgi:hypothetical protein
VYIFDDLYFLNTAFNEEGTLAVVVNENNKTLILEFE